MFGDTVVIELADRSEWRRKFKKVVEEDDNEQEYGVSTGVEEGQQVVDSGLVKYLEDNPDLVPKGKVVAIAKRNLKSYCGSLNLSNVIYKHTNQSMTE